MNLEGKIDLIKQAVLAIKEAILGKNVTPSGNVSTYADAIDSIVTPNNQTKTVTSNGTVTYDVGYTGLESVTVNVNQSVQNKTITENGTYTADSGYIGLGTVSVNVPIPSLNYIVRNGNSESIIDSNGNALSLSADKINSNDAINLFQRYRLDNNISTVYLSNISQINKSSVFYETFNLCSYLTDVDLSALTSINADEALYAFCSDCSRLVNIDISNLTTIKGEGSMANVFNNCSSLTSIDLSSLTTINDNGNNVDKQYTMEEFVANCGNLTNINLNGLTTIWGELCFLRAFQLTGITSMSFPSLTTINSSNCFHSAFDECSNLTTLSFPSLTSNSFGSYTNQFYNMLSNVENCTVHFPSNLQSVIGSWSDIIGGFGGTNTVVLFDLPATT